MGPVEGNKMNGREWLDILVCPVCKGKLDAELGAAGPESEAAPGKSGSRLICRTCRKAYPVKDGIPVMLVEEAQSLEGAT